ncbi:Pol protein [Phytophthora palmivora]|uniref:Pol protein n=1 Tax=Phytophthora palmivora TaxID=4796 RepID=A0A2P4YTT0_9STRA|nr:Pol protein [Phytophthora palmivora]
MELGMAVQSSIRCYGCEKLGKCNVPALREGKEGLEGPVAEATTQEPGELGSPVGAGCPTEEDLSPHARSADGARHGGLAPESLAALETRKSSGGLLVVHASVRGYGNPSRILPDSGASTKFLDARRSRGMATIPRGVKKTITRAGVSLSTSRVGNQVPHSESEAPPARPVDDQYHVFDGVSNRKVKALPEVSALLNLERLSMKDFLAELAERLRRWCS